MVISLLLAQDRLEKLAATQKAYASEIHAPLYDKDNPEPAIRYWADYFDVSYTELDTTIRCESAYNPAAKGDRVAGVYTSFGIAQFHNPETDWGFSKENAHNPDFALPRMARAFSEGEQRRWSCWKIHFGSY